MFFCVFFENVFITKNATNAPNHGKPQKLKAKIQQLIHILVVETNTQL